MPATTALRRAPLFLIALITLSITAYLLTQPTDSTAAQEKATPTPTSAAQNDDSEDRGCESGGLCYEEVRIQGLASSIQ